MKIIATTDWHIRPSAPKHRKDKFSQVQLEKILWIINRTKEEFGIILNAGDVFDSAECPYHLVNQYIKALTGIETPGIIAVPGQHDLRYHNLKTYQNTPLANLEAAGIMSVISNPSDDFYNSMGDIFVYGAGWGMDIPEVKDKHAYNILLIHRMVTPKGPMWPGQTDYITAKDLLKQNPDYNLIISGDNHMTFAEEEGDRILVNPGPIMRMTSDKLNFKPKVGIIDTDENTLIWEKIPIESGERVFDLDGISKQEAQRDNAKLQEFLDGLIHRSEESPNFIRAVQKVISEVKPKEGVKQMVNRFLGQEV